LYGDFATYEHTNPDGYKANVDEWTHALVAATRDGVIPPDPHAAATLDSRFILPTGDHLLKALETRQYGIPVALGKVIQDAVKRRDMIELHEFKSSPTSIYQKRWLPSIPSLGDILLWSWTSLVGSKNTLPKGQWVIPQNLEAASSLLLHQLQSHSQSPTESIHTLSSIQQSLPLSHSDLSLLLTYLSRDKALITTAPLPSDTAIKLGTAPLSSNDITIATLKNLLSSLSTGLPTLESSIQDLDSRARSAVLSKNTSAARAALRRKKLLQDTLDRRNDQIHNVQSTLLKIDEAADNVAMVRAMEASASVLKHLNSQIGGADGAERVADALAEEMHNVEEITNVINDTGAAGVVDEQDVEDEFEALMREEKDKEDKVARERKDKEEAARAEAALQEQQERDAVTAQKLADLEDFERRIKEERQAKERDGEVEKARKAMESMGL